MAGNHQLIIAVVAALSGLVAFVMLRINRTPRIRSTRQYPMEHLGDVRGADVLNQFHSRGDTQ